MEDLSASQVHEALKVRAGSSILRAAKLIEKLRGEGVSAEAINSEQVQSDLMKASKLHTELAIYESFLNGVKSGLESGELEQSAGRHLESLVKVYGLKCLSSELLPLLTSNYFSHRQGPLVEEALKREIKKLRPFVLPLAEAFGQPDEMIFSAIGSKTLEPYKTLVEWTKQHNPVNKEDPLPGFKEFVLPLMRPKL